MMQARTLVALIACLALAGCSTMWDATKKAAQVVWEPDTPVGEAKEQPTGLTYSLVALDQLNPNASGDSTPLEFHVFQLEDDSKFLAADYDQMVKDFKEALGTNYIDHKDYTLLPGQFKFVGPLKVEEEASYIGVMAHYADPDIAQWKKVVKIQTIGREYHLLMQFGSSEVKLVRVE